MIDKIINVNGLVDFSDKKTKAKATKEPTLNSKFKYPPLREAFHTL